MVMTLVWQGYWNTCGTKWATALTRVIHVLAVVIPRHWLSPTMFVEVTPTRSSSSQDFWLCRADRAKQNVNIRDICKEGR